MPRYHAIARTALGLVLVLLPALAVAGVRVLPGKDSRPEVQSSAPYLPVPVPCDQAILDLTLTIAMQETYTDTTAGDGVVDAYACNSGTPLTGPEHVYILTASEDLIADIWLATNVPVDHDLVLLSDCDSDACLAQANSELSAEIPAGVTVYLVVDGYQGDAGEYMLTLETRPVGIPDAICNGGAVPIDIPAAGGTAEADTLFGRDNLVSLYDCAPYTVRGGESWYALAFAPADTDTVGIGYGEMFAATITVSTNSPSLDLALWLFADCGTEAECLAFVDLDVAGGQEVLEWNNPLPDLTTVYLAVDCIRAPADTLSGIFDLQIDTAVPVETHSISSVRNRFR